MFLPRTPTVIGWLAVVTVFLLGVAACSRAKMGLPKTGLNVEVLAAGPTQRIELHFNADGDLTDAQGKNPKTPPPADLREAFTTPPW